MMMAVPIHASSKMDSAGTMLFSRVLARNASQIWKMLVFATPLFVGSILHPTEQPHQGVAMATGWELKNVTMVISTTMICVTTIAESTMVDVGMVLLSKTTTKNVSRLFKQGSNARRAVATFSLN